jgi:hypothetical protein
MKLKIREELFTELVPGFRASDKKDLEKARNDSRSIEIDIKFRPTIRQIIDYFGDISWIKVQQYGNVPSKQDRYSEIPFKYRFPKKDIFSGTVDTIPDEILDMFVETAHWFTKYKKHDALCVGVPTLDDEE